MRVLLDTNVYLSYLLAPDTERVITSVVTACFTQDAIDLLAPPEQVEELVRRAATKRYFQTRIPRAALGRFADQLRVLHSLAPLPEEVPAYSRDPNDDYLVAYGVVNEVDWLVTGDADLLVLAQVGRLAIVTPARFLRLLREQGYLP